MSWQNRLRDLKRDTYALYLAYKDPRVPWHARLWAAVVVGYALSPIDLIPDFIPVVGYLDDLILIPLGLLLAVKMIPKEVMESCRERAEVELVEKRPVTWYGVVIITVLWLLFASLVVHYVSSSLGLTLSFP
jgi:uncharacterized membrane protein YkvA (DUF1232 family)